MVLHLVQLQTISTELLQPNLSIKFLWAEEEVPIGSWSTSRTLGICFHVVGIDFSFVYAYFIFTLLVYRNDTRPIVIEQAITLTIAAI